MAKEYEVATNYTNDDLISPEVFSVQSVAEQLNKAIYNADYREVFRLSKVLTRIEVEVTERMEEMQRVGISGACMQSPAQLQGKQEKKGKAERK